jgi:serralysin
MSYRSHVGESATSGYVNETWSFAQSLMMYDIAAIQHLYGANFSTNSGNTIYSWGPTTGEMFINGVGQGAPGGTRIFQTLWDGAGTDTYDFSRYTTSLSIDLRPGNWTKTSTVQLAKLSWDGSEVAAGNIANALLYRGNKQSQIENAVGGSGNDKITGNDTANSLRGGAGNDRLTGREGNDVLNGGPGADKLYGQGGHDKLVGGSGKDTLFGGDGADIFVFTSIMTSRPDARDTINDFVRGVDRIDLRTIDANTLKGGNQAFAFIGKAAFHHKPGELRYASGIVAGDVNGDGSADFQIKMANLLKITKGDFYL